MANEWGNETQVVAAIKRRILKVWPGSWVLKVAGGPYQEPGVPDLLVCVQGQFIGLEVKHQKPGESRQHALGRASVQQHEQIRRIWKAGGTAGVVLDPDEAEQVVRVALLRAAPRLT